MAEQKQKRTRRTEGEQAIDTYEKITRRVEAKGKQYAKAVAQANAHQADLEDLQASQRFWASHPAVEAHLEQAGQEEALPLEG